MATGQIHKTTFLNIITKGRVAVCSVDGRKEYKAGDIFTTYPGTKRAVYGLEDTVWCTVHVTDKEDVNDIAEDILAKDYHDPELLAYFEEK
jgi:quercetin dioxygenase-like cupin family protein